MPKLTAVMQIRSKGYETKVTKYSGYGKARLSERFKDNRREGPVTLETRGETPMDTHQEIPGPTFPQKNCPKPKLQRALTEVGNGERNARGVQGGGGRRDRGASRWASAAVVRKL